MRAVIRVSTVEDGNLAFHTVRDGAALASAQAARERFLRRHGMDAGRVVAGQQVHGARVREVAEQDAGRGSASAEDALPGTDGLATRVPLIPLMVLGADCPLVCLHDPEGAAIAVLHAGWRGIAAGVLEAGLRALAVPSRSAIRAYLGAAAGRCCYEVGEEVAQHFPEEAVQRKAGAPRPHLDLRRAVELRLGRPVEVVGTDCTICDPRYFSHRRDGRPDRHALVAMLAP